MHIKHLLMAAATITSVCSPIATHACGYMNYEHAVFGTPLSAKGRFVFVTRISRRLLKESVAEHQQPVRRSVVVKEII